MVVFTRMKAYAIYSTYLEATNEGTVFQGLVHNAFHAVCQNGKGI